MSMLSHTLSTQRANRNVLGCSATTTTMKSTRTTAIATTTTTTTLMTPYECDVNFFFCALMHHHLSTWLAVFHRNQEARWRQRRRRKNWEKQLEIMFLVWLPLQTILCSIFALPLLLFQLCVLFFFRYFFFAHCYLCHHISILFSLLRNFNFFLFVLSYILRILKLMLIYISLTRSLARPSAWSLRASTHYWCWYCCCRFAWNILFPCFVYYIYMHALAVCAKWFCSFAEFSNENNSNMCAQFSTNNLFLNCFRCWCALFFGSSLWLLLWLFCYFFYPAFLDYFNIRVYRICKRFRAQTHTHTRRAHTCKCRPTKAIALPEKNEKPHIEMQPIITTARTMKRGERRLCSRNVQWWNPVKKAKTKSWNSRVLPFCTFQSTNTHTEICILHMHTTCAWTTRWMDSTMCLSICTNKWMVRSFGRSFVRSFVVNEINSQVGKWEMK